MIMTSSVMAERKSYNEYGRHQLDYVTRSLKAFYSYTSICLGWEEILDSKYQFRYHSIIYEPGFAI